MELQGSELPESSDVTAASAEKVVFELATGSVDTEDVCPQCACPVTYSEEGIQCDSCDTWYHAECEDLGAEHLDQLKREEDAPWYCGNCLMFGIEEGWNGKPLQKSSGKTPLATEDSCEWTRTSSVPIPPDLPHEMNDPSASNINGALNTTGMVIVIDFYI